MTVRTRIGFVELQVDTAHAANPNLYPCNFLVERFLLYNSYFVFSSRFFNALGRIAVTFRLCGESGNRPTASPSAMRFLQQPEEVAKGISCRVGSEVFNSHIQERRKELLPLAYRFANFPASVKSKYEIADCFYQARVCWFLCSS